MHTRTSIVEQDDSEHQMSEYRKSGSRNRHKQSFTGLLVPCVAHPDDMEPPDAEEDKGIADRYLHAGNIVGIRACPRDRC